MSKVKEFGPYTEQKTLLTPMAKVSRGQPKKYSPEQLMDMFLEYCQWCIDNPIFEEKPFGTGYVHTVKHLRAMTLQGFFVYSGLYNSTWYEYETYADYTETCTRIRNAMFSQKIEAAAAGQMDSMIVARDLGLTDKQDVNIGAININIALPGMAQAELPGNKPVNIDQFQDKPKGIDK